MLEKYPEDAATLKRIATVLFNQTVDTLNKTSAFKYLSASATGLGTAVSKRKYSLMDGNTGREVISKVVTKQVIENYKKNPTMYKASDVLNQIVEHPLVKEKKTKIDETIKKIIDNRTAELDPDAGKSEQQVALEAHVAKRERNKKETHRH